MSFNLLSAVVHGAESFLMSGGNPAAAGVGALEGGLSPQQQSQQIPQIPDLQPDELRDFASKVGL